MSTKNARSRQTFIRTTSQANGDGIKAHYLRGAVQNCQGLLAAGKHHLSSWMGSRALSGSFTTADKGGLTKVTPGPNAAYLQVVFFIQPVSAEASLQVASSTSNAITIPAGVESFSSTTNIHEVLINFAVTGGVETDIWFQTDGDYLVKGMTVADLPLNAIESGDTGYVDLSGYYRGKELTVAAVQNIVQCQESVLANLRKVHVNLASYINDEPLETVEPGSSTANFFDTSLTTYAKTTAPGFWIRPGAPYNGQDETRVKCRVKASSSSGTGILKFIASESAETSNIALSSTVDWYSTTLDLVMPDVLQDQYADKVELHCQDSTASSTIDLYALVIEEMDGTS